MTVVLGKWDIGLDYRQTRILLENLINSHAGFLTSILPNTNRTIAKKFVYSSIAYIQLTNGMRIGEATVSLREYVNEKKTTFKIPAEKTKVPRPVKIPQFIQKYYTLYNVYRDIVARVKANTVIKFLERNFNWNTHALRYAFIRYAIEKGYSAETLALILGHKKIDTTLNYARNINAEKILEDLQE